MQLDNQKYKSQSIQELMVDRSKHMKVDCQETRSLEHKLKVNSVDTFNQTINMAAGTGSNRDDIQIDYCPAPVREFTGRQEELEELKKMFEDHQVIAVVGRGGVGKSQLARRYAELYKSTYQYRFWIAADTAEKVNSSFQELADKLDVKATSKSVLVNDIYKTFTKGRVLLIFDNVVRPRHVYEYLPTRFQLTDVTVNILITSGWKDWTTISEVSMVLHPFEAEVSVDLLQKLMENVSVQTDEKNWRDLANAMGHLPLALRLSSSFIKVQPKYTIQGYITVFSKLLANTLPAYGSDRLIYVTTIITWESLGKNSKSLVNAAAYFDAEKILKPDLVPLIPKAYALEAALADVTKYALFHDEGTGRFTMHRVIQTSIQQYQEVKNKHKLYYSLTLNYALKNPHSHQCDSVFAHANQYKELIVLNYNLKRSHRQVILKYLLKNRCTDVLKIIFECREHHRYDKYDAIYLALEAECSDMFLFTLSYVTIDHVIIFYLFDKACDKDNRFVVQFLLANSFISVTELYDDKQTLLHRAAANASTSIVSLILELNKNIIDIQDRWGNTALYTAIKSYNKTSDSSETVSLMLGKRKLDFIDTRLDTDTKVRRDIPKSRVIEIVRVLIENGASIVIRNEAGYTPLHYSTLFKAVELVSFINQLNSTLVNIVDKDGCTALHRLCVDYTDAFEKQVIEIARVLIKYGASVIIRDKDGCTPLHCASLYKVVELVSLIIESDNTVVNIVDNNGHTALHRLCLHYPDRSEKREIDTARVLIKNGASVVIRDRDDRTALHSAASYAHAQLVTLLTQSNKEVIDIVDNRRNTALHLVASNYTEEGTYCVRQTISSLIENGLSIHTLNSDGHSPIDTISYKYKHLFRRLADEHEKSTLGNNGTM